MQSRYLDLILSIESIGDAPKISYGSVLGILPYVAQFPISMPTLADIHQNNIWALHRHMMPKLVMSESDDDTMGICHTCIDVSKSIQTDPVHTWQLIDWWVAQRSAVSFHALSAHPCT